MLMTHDSRFAHNTNAENIGKVEFVCVRLSAKEMKDLTLSNIYLVLFRIYLGR